jgi:hypothetical protein
MAAPEGSFTAMLTGTAWRRDVNRKKNVIIPSLFGGGIKYW